jgi:hypothetical protein
MTPHGHVPLQFSNVFQNTPPDYIFAKYHHNFFGTLAREQCTAKNGKFLQNQQSLVISGRSAKHSIFLPYGVF